jgi:hypothetical protein
LLVCFECDLWAVAKMYLPCEVLCGGVVRAREVEVVYICLLFVGCLDFSPITKVFTCEHRNPMIQLRGIVSLVLSRRQSQMSAATAAGCVAAPCRSPLHIVA